MTARLSLLVVSAVGLMLAACAGGAGVAPVATIPVPPPTVVPPSPITPSPIDFDTAEYRRSNGAVAALAISAYRAGATGAGITVAVIDSGVTDANGEFTGRISPFSRDLAGSRGVSDEDGHGTEVSAILLAARDGRNIHGVAFGATLLALRTDRPGSCAETEGCRFDSNAIASGFDAAAAAGARVVNVSLGGASATAGIRNAAARASAAGAVIVTSAGNDGKDEVEGFAADIRTASPLTVIIAGAVDESRTIASFSNRAGAAAESFLVALGLRVRSFDHLGVSYFYTGTSESAPIVAGAAALLAQAYPGLTPAQIVDILLRTADDLGAIGTDPIYGRGALNIDRAFAPIGALSIEKVAVPVTTSAIGVLSGPLGGAPQLGAAVSKLPVQDLYGREYTIDLAAALQRQAPGRLANALLGADVASGGGRYGGAEVAVSVRGGEGAGWRGDIATGVDWRDRPRAAILGGQVHIALAPGRALALGYGTSVAAMLDTAGGVTDAVVPFVATRAGESGFMAQSLGSAAMVQQSGAWTIGGAIGSQSLASGNGSAPARHTRALLRADRWLGRVRLGFGIEHLVEQGSLLGTQLPPVFGVSGATTTAALVRIEIPLGDWSLFGDARLGSTIAALSGAGLVQDAARLSSTAASLALSHSAVFKSDDRISLTIAQPLRATGSIDLATQAAAVRLGPSGRETAFEIDYLRPLNAGSLSLGAFWREQPGNIAAAAADAGVAARFRLRF